MTANTLSNSDRAKVASAVTHGPNYCVRNGGVAPVNGAAGDAFGWEWKPDFDSWTIGRSQALSIIEWLCKNKISGTSLAMMRDSIKRRDTAALEYMIFQMITKGKEDE